MGPRRRQGPRRRARRGRDGEPAGRRWREHRAEAGDAERPARRRAGAKSARRRAREFALQGLYQWLRRRDDAGVIDRAHARAGRLRQGRRSALRRAAARLHRRSRATSTPCCARHVDRKIAAAVADRARRADDRRLRAARTASTSRTGSRSTRRSSSRRASAAPTATSTSTACSTRRRAIARRRGRSCARRARGSTPLADARDSALRSGVAHIRQTARERSRQTARSALHRRRPSIRTGAMRQSTPCALSQQGAPAANGELVLRTLRRGRFSRVARGSPRLSWSR